MKKISEQGSPPNGSPRHAPCLVALLPAWITPRAAVGDFERSAKI